MVKRIQCLVLLDAGNKNVGRAIEYVFCLRFSFDAKVSKGHSAGAHETLEILNGMLYSFDHPEQSSAEQGRAKASKVVPVGCTPLGEMLDSFDQGLTCTLQQQAFTEDASVIKGCFSWGSSA